MQTALQRRQRHRRNGAARRGRGGGAARRAALAIPLLLFSSFLVLGGVGFISTVSAYAYYSNGLPDPSTALDPANLQFEQPSVIYDRTGKLELARFGELRREILTFDQIPAEMVDATTSVEDKDFWTNPGFDIGAVVSAGLDTLSGRPRGASTITQQLVRAKLLPAEAFEGSVYDRKIREIIQSIRLTQAYPGTDGKQQIMAAYLNQNFYGNQSYGVAAAAMGYFGKPVAELDLAQYATLAAIPQSPTKYDLMRNKVDDCQVDIAEDETCPANQVKLIVPDTTEIVARRNHVLDLMKTRSVLSAGKHTPAEFDAAMTEPMELHPVATPQRKAPHFVWQVRHDLGALLCGADQADSCEAVDTGGYQVTSTLNWTYQQVVDKWVYIAGRAPLAKTSDGTRKILKDLGVKASDYSWILGLRGKDIHNAAGSIIDYRTGQVLATSGSADFNLRTKDKHFSPEYDVMFDGFRQPGSSIKPLGYITGLDDHTMTASTMFMDVVTEFERNWAPADADRLERGPVRLRSALQFSLNIPAIKSGYINGFDHLFAQYKKFGLTFLEGAVPTPSMAIGTLEIHMVDLLGAYGAIANGGVLMPRQVILEVKDHNGKVVYPTAEDRPVGKVVASPQAAYIISNILEGNTIKSVNAYWARWMVLEGGKRRPAAYKTGTTDESKDIDAFGYVAPPKDPKSPAIAVGVWMGNSDAAPVKPVLSTTTTAPLWNRIITEVTKGTPITEFKEPDGIVEQRVDAYSGMLPGPGTVKTVSEMFIKGTEDSLRRDDMHSVKDIDQATGDLWQEGCTGPKVSQEFLDFSNVESRFPQWQKYTQGWAERAAKGSGVRGGPKRTPTTYFFDGFLVPFGRSWGGKFAPSDVCSAVPPTCQPGGGPPFESQEPCISPEPTLPGPTPTKSNGHKTPLPTLPVQTGPAARGSPNPTGLAAVVFLPFLVPLFTFAIGRRFKLDRPGRPLFRNRRRR
jgi:membrane peptidoglycan carboxypeptidase